MDEKWIDIEEFPDYAISSLGRILNLKQDTILRPSRNAQGLAKIGLVRDRIQHTRSVAILVAVAFVEKPSYQFDTPINLDGDRMNNRADNLMWRPRWFAIKYHQQFYHEGFYTSPVKLSNTSTGEEGLSLSEIATRYGLLASDILLSAHNGISVFPTAQYFVFGNK